MRVCVCVCACLSVFLHFFIIKETVSVCIERCIYKKGQCKVKKKKKLNLMNGALPSSCGNVRGFLCVKLYSQQPFFSFGGWGETYITAWAWLHIVTSAAILHTSRAETLRCFFSDGPTHARHEEHCNVFVVVFNVHWLFLHKSTCQVSSCTVGAEGRVQTVTRWWLMETDTKSRLWNADLKKKM